MVPPPTDGPPGVGDDVATTGTGLSRLVDVQNRQFKAVSCTRCGYTEFYRTGGSDALLDLFLG
ncbi:Predicted nucleic-acid-binding protein, contains Zn-ribbon domain [Halogeometricum rufum]|uniref:Predicted nucleic-acid-binding protein, contains Zn-ribbon domain n=1 Tax=Halogeometricum rufum TaxID=553469 RepID=A0A1I6I282_9EURY|nr:zinc ribbon domain-containing protein [Halogeometricum rufum]SFR60832.1 Predicted nucleic-acid-binding protein, contains Zn-ribbon domain [Halogeometricum rufum]